MEPHKAIWLQKNAGGERESFDSNKKNREGRQGEEKI